MNKYKRITIIILNGFLKIIGIIKWLDFWFRNLWEKAISEMPFIFLDSLDEPFYERKLYFQNIKSNVFLSEYFPLIRDILQDLEKNSESSFFIQYINSISS